MSKTVVFFIGAVFLAYGGYALVQTRANPQVRRLRLIVKPLGRKEGVVKTYGLTHVALSVRDVKRSLNRTDITRTPRAGTGRHSGLPHFCCA